MAFQYVLVKNSGRGRGYLPTIMPEASIFASTALNQKRRRNLFLPVICEIENNCKNIKNIGYIMNIVRLTNALIHVKENFLNKQNLPVLSDVSQ